MGVQNQVVFGLLIGMIFCAACVSPGNTNRPAFLALCNLIQLTEKEVTLPAFVNTPTDLENDLIKLNMTTAEDNWYNLFPGNGESVWEQVKSEEKFKVFAGEEDTLWAQMYEKWEKAKKELLAESAEEGPKEFARPPAGARRTIARVKIQRMWRFYEETEKKRSGLKEKLEAQKAEIEKAFQLARAGTETGSVTSESFNTANRSTACGGKGADATGKSLANDLTCLCSATNIQYAQNVCTDGLPGQLWSTNDRGSERTDAYTAIKNVWDAEAVNDLKPTAHTIEKLLRNFTGLLGKGVAEGT
ncbi:unnamed protein product [Trypanosoma congolense IL3000]|uniref:WGS project CAEQ00000000 data, annotated contig 822 n=1 Tax=Trypanosoma congolense (strain IL3000) TaxID=1068625 RepID=F9WIQ5_TRYCI|nr:unnamed protein product [Trypanosoma congolense IL3000]